MLSHPLIERETDSLHGLLGDTQLLAGLGDGIALCKQHVRFTELVNNLFGVVSFLWHGSDLLNWLFTTLDLDQEDGARSRDWPGLSP